MHVHCLSVKPFGYLASLLFALQKEQRGSVLAAHNVIVESHGIRHWLGVSSSKETGIAMNLKFQMPPALSGIWPGNFWPPIRGSRLMGSQRSFGESM